MKNDRCSPAQANRKFVEKLRTRGVDVQACYQCGRCSAGCPVSSFFDLSVMEAVRLAAYGQEEPLLSSSTIWLCAACETCATRCPNGIDIAVLMDLLRELALRKGISPAQPRVQVFHEAFLDSVKHWGRAYEVGLIAAYKVRSGDWFGDLRLGLQMCTKGKLGLLPHPIKERAAMAKIFSGLGKEYER